MKLPYHISVRFPIYIFLVVTLTASDQQQGGFSGVLDENQEVHEDGEGEVDVSNLTLYQFCKLFELNETLCECSIIGEELCMLLKKSNTTINKEPVGPLIHCDSISRIQAIIIVTMSIFGVIGNSLVICVTYHCWKKSSICHKLIGGLAFADFLVCILNIIDTTPLLWTCTAVYGEVLCKLGVFSKNSAALIGLGFILIVAIERFVGICYPFTRGLSSRMIVILLIANVLFACFTNSPLLVVTEINKFAKCSQSWPNELYPKIYSWLMLAFSFLLPIIVISAMYCKIIWTLTKSRHQCLEMNGNHQSDQQLRRNKEHQRIMIILILVLTAFILLVSPDKFIWAMKDQGLLDGLSVEVLDILHMCSIIPFGFHVVINPIIYSVVDQKFRSSLSSLFCKSRRQTNNMTTIHENNNEVQLSNFSTQYSINIKAI